MSRVNDLVQIRLKAKGLRQKDLSDYLGYSSPQFVSNWSRGVSSPPLKVAPKLCKFLGISKTEYKRLLISDYKDRVDRQFGEG